MKRMRILFVDDDESILRGFRLLLRSERARWDVLFSNSGAEALAEMRRAPADVVVSDMQMPGMDGAALLTHVRDEFPMTARIVLSGHIDGASVLRTLPITQQLLGKPCDVAVLKEAIARACDSQELVKNDTMRALLGRCARLPSPPQTYLDLTQAAGRLETSLADVARIVQRDPAMSVTVLQLVNSAYFGVADRIISVERAVSLLGLNMIKTLALAAGVFASSASLPMEGFSVAEFQRLSLAAARLARALAKGSPHIEACFAAALIHDIGRVVLAAGLNGEYSAVIRDAEKSGRALEVVEAERLGLTHAAVGAYLLGVWGLPAPIVDAVTHHHHPSEPPVGNEYLRAIVHLASQLTQEPLPADPAALPCTIDLEFLRHAGLPLTPEAWRTAAVAALATPDSPSIPSPAKAGEGQGEGPRFKQLAP